MPTSQPPADGPPAIPRPDLSRDRIVAAALDLVRAEGLEALTMRGLAARLGCGAMSLYRHVADRRALLVAMLDHIAQSLRVPPQPDPRAEVAAIMTAVHATFRAEPWLVRVLIFEGLESLDILPLIERILAACAALGLPPDRATLVYATLIQHAYGEALSSAYGRGPEQLERLRRAVVAGDYPHLARVMTAAPQMGADRYPDQLAALLEGLLVG
jgi:AcrR family transcriptional regulator